MLVLLSDVRFDCALYFNQTQSSSSAVYSLRKTNGNDNGDDDDDDDDDKNDDDHDDDQGNVGDHASYEGVDKMTREGGGCLPLSANDHPPVWFGG